MAAICRTCSRVAWSILPTVMASLLFFSTTCSKSDDTKDAGPDASGDADSDADGDTDTVIDTETYTDGECGGSVTPCGSLPYLPCQGQMGCTGSRTCEGTPQQCGSIIMTAKCSTQQGCSWNGSCLGMAKQCNSILSSVQCSSQYGCIWDINVNRCGGGATSCQAIGYVNCGKQQGCNLTGSCAGTASGCGELSVVQCTNQAGCNLVDHCSGVPEECTTLSDWQDCLGQEGCEWI